MAFKVQVGPAQIAIHQGQTVLLTEPGGEINWPSKGGLYFRDTRVISAWAIYANGELWDLLNGGAVAPHAARIFQTNRAFASEDGPIAARTAQGNPPLVVDKLEASVNFAVDRDGSGRVAILPARPLLDLSHLSEHGNPTDPFDSYCQRALNWLKLPSLRMVDLQQT
jgi:hypothetical protein